MNTNGEYSNAIYRNRTVKINKFASHFYLFDNSSVNKINTRDREEVRLFLQSDIAGFIVKRIKKYRSYVFLRCFDKYIRHNWKYRAVEIQIVC